MNYKLASRDDYKKTGRGFVIFGEFVDRYGSDVVVQESSIAFEPCVWIFASNKHMENPAPHLTPENARELIKALQEFVDVSELEDKS